MCAVLKSAHKKRRGVDRAPLEKAIQAFKRNIPTLTWPCLFKFNNFVLRLKVIISRFFKGPTLSPFSVPFLFMDTGGAALHN